MPGLEIDKTCNVVAFPTSTNGSVTSIRRINTPVGSFDRMTLILLGLFILLFVLASKK